ncbi:MAG: hypothetical protein RLZZ568_1319 [Cyanobacteriota bacterium]
MNWLLISDLDNTWVGDQSALEKLQAYLADRRESFYLVYATGRSFGSAKTLQQTVGLMEPNCWITAVGSEIYDDRGLDRAWANYLSDNWQRETIQAIAAHYPQLTPQSPSEQNPWKISYHLEPDGDPMVIAAIKHNLQKKNLSVQVMFSSGRDVDFLPLRSNKGNATHYLQQRWQIPGEKTLVCGDSGNDISLFETDSRGIIVNNAQAELLAWYDKFGASRHYLAKSPHAAGILEGIAYFKLANP